MDLLANSVLPFDYLLPGLDGDQRTPPKEFRLFPAGKFSTEKGEFLFDAESQTTVMDSYARRGVDLTMDYEHQALQDPPVEAPAACKSWVPQIRNGELWATECKWTDRAFSYLLAGEYRYFSPAFSHDDDGRVKEVLNVALTNMPAMRGIAPLVAASRLQAGKETAMDWEAKCKELQTQLGELTAKLTALESTNAELTAKLTAKDGDATTTAAVEEVKTLTATLSLGTGAGAKERTAAVASLASLRRNVFGLTGEQNEASAMGKVMAWKSASEQVTQLSARVNELETEKVDGEFKAVLDEASAKGLPPAKRNELEAEAKKLNGGRINRDSIAFLRTCLSVASFVPPGGVKQPPVAGAGDLDPLEVHIANIQGKDIAKLKADRAKAAEGK